MKSMLVLRKAYQKMVKAYKGHHGTMDQALGMTESALENRLYQIKEQEFKVSTSLQMQELSKTTHFAEAIAQISGGVFVKLPEHEDCSREELLTKFNTLYAEVGNLSSKFSNYTADDEIDKKERHDLSEVGQKIHKDVQELLALTFAIYCADESDD